MNYREIGNMRKKDLEEIIYQPGAVLVAEISPERNKYFIQIAGVHYKISSKQFELLLQYGYFEENYEIDPLMGFETHIHRRR